MFPGLLSDYATQVPLVGKAFAVATPDYVQQVIISDRRQRGGDKRTSSTRGGVFRRPSVTSSVWASVDMLTVALAAFCAVRFRVTLPSDIPKLHVMHNLMDFYPRMLFFYVCWFGICVVFFTHSYGLYGPVQNRSGLHEQRMTIQAVLTSGLLLCGTLYLSNGEEISRIVIALMVVFTLVLLCVRRAIRRWLVYRRYRAGIDTRNVLIVGAGRVGQALRNHIESLQHLGFRFKGFIALTAREAELGGADVVGDVRNCLSLARSLFVDEIFFSVPGDKKLVIDMVEEARIAGIDVRVVPDLYDGLAWNARVEYIGQFPTIPLHRKVFPIGGFLMKRMLDIAVSLFALILASPVMLAIAIAIRLDSQGKIFYGATRIGRKGRPFCCYKFRTMVSNADQLKKDLEHMNERGEILFKIVKDPRITKVGRLLRKYSLDELPQFYNVLKGDMSLVGPRPPIASEVEKYNIAHLRRLDVLPGITGLWQVEARQDPSFDSYISLDTAYVENWSFLMDLRILARTVGVVFSGTGS